MTAKSASATPGPKILRSELNRIAISGLLGLLICALLLTSLTTYSKAFVWLLACAIVWLLVWQQTNKRLALNRAHASSPLYPNLGWANCMTLTRGWLIAATAGFLTMPSVMHEHTILVWIAAAAYSIAAILDRLDGFVARKTQGSSLLGAELDTVFDALGLMVAPLLALQLGKIHWSYLLVSVAYYLFVLGIKTREKNNKPVYPLAPSKLRRTLAGFQMGYVAVVLWPPFDAQVSVLAGFGFMLPLLAGFLVDWFVVSGRIDPYESATAKLFKRMHSLTENLLLPALRIILLLSLFYIWKEAEWHSASFLTVCLSASMVALVMIGLMMIALVMISLGLAGRTGAMVLLMLLAWTVPLPVYDPVFMLVLFSAVAILLLGCGRFSLWQADDDWVNRQDGA